MIETNYEYAILKGLGVRPFASNDKINFYW